MLKKSYGCEAVKGIPDIVLSQAVAAIAVGLVTGEAGGGSQA